MMRYLIILLSDQSTSFCSYSSYDRDGEDKLIPIEILQKAIKYAFMEDLRIQFVLPPFALPQQYKDIIASTKASIIAPASSNYDADVLVIEGISGFKDIKVIPNICYVLRTNKEEFFKQYKEILERLVEISRLNIVYSDVENFTDHDFESYKGIMNEFTSYIKDLVLLGKNIQLNLLTDRLLNNEMNNCNAGYKTITLAPNGCFYICPAFYYAKEPSVGNIEKGLAIKNSQLYKLGYAPLCKECDAYQCRRCVYLNKVLTREVNIPSHEQCVMAHIERNASRDLLMALREYVAYMPKIEIKEITYLDPFDNIKNKQL